MKSDEILISAIEHLRKSIIGIFVPQFNRTCIEFITEIDDNNIVTISIGKWLGVQTNHNFVDNGRVVMFPDGITYSDLLENPLDFTKFVTDNNL